MSNFKQLIQSRKPVLIDFYADWCAPCKTMNPVLKEVKDHFKEEVSILKINVDKNQNLAAQLQVKGVPTLLLFKDEKLLWRQSGVVSKKELINTINKFIE